MLQGEGGDFVEIWRNGDLSGQKWVVSEQK